MTPRIRTGGLEELENIPISNMSTNREVFYQITKGRITFISLLGKVNRKQWRNV